MTQQGPPPPPPGKELPGNKGEKTASIDQVRQAELDYLWWHRHASKSRKEDVEGHLIGLALSGGGIRSATTCLGLLQALSKMQILPLVDYLSTVSGGGYIGACLSTLLSLNKAEIRRSPEAPPNCRVPPGGDKAESVKPGTYRSDDRPAFSTEWRRFPFRAERRDRYGRLGTDLVAHLRTHGNFLVARRGLFRRESMRAVGHLLTGISFNVGLFLLTLFIASSLLLLSARLLVPDLPAALLTSRPDSTADSTIVGLTIPQDTLPRELVPGVSTRTSVELSPCEPGRNDAECKTRTQWEPTSYGARIRRTVNVMIVEAASALRFFAFPLLVGAGLSVFVFAWIVIVLGWYLKGTQWGGTPRPGESADDRFEGLLLQQLSWFALGIVVLTATALRWFHEDCPTLTGNRRLLLLLVPVAVLVGARFVSYLVALIGPTFKTWTRRFRSIWGGYQAVTIYGCWMMLALAAVPIAAYAMHEHRLAAGFSALGALLLTRVLASRGAIVGGGRFRIPPGLRQGLLGLAVILVVALGLVFFGSLLADRRSETELAYISLAGLLLFLALGYLVDHNKLGPHYFYRDRLAETYLLSELADEGNRLRTFRDSMEMSLADLHGEPADGTAPLWKNPAPYHLISAAINLAGSRDLTRKDRKSGYWLFSKLFCGSTHTGFRPTKCYRDGETKLARAIGISGAAASSAIGTATFFAQAFATVVFNIRLGYWMDNPRMPNSLRRQGGRVFWPAQLWSELTMNTTESRQLVNLSDGGHTGDNVGVYPLFQRRCKVIIACDAERDPTLSFGSFTEALRHAYVDLGVDVDIDLTMLRPDPATGYCRSHCAVGRVRYPDRPNQESFLIYLKNSLTGDEPEPILNYKNVSPAFPHESTVDQFFDDAQFESYRALGVHLAEHTFGHWNTTKGFEFVSEQHWPG